MAGKLPDINCELLCTFLYSQGLNRSRLYVSGTQGSATTWGIAFGSETIEPAIERSKLNFTRLPIELTPLEVFAKLHRKYETAYLLESIEGPKKLAQYSFVGFDPEATITAKNTLVTICDRRTDESLSEKTDDPLGLIKRYVDVGGIPSHGFRLVGGAVGYVSYDATRYWEKLPERTVDDLQFPDMQFGVFDDGIVFDHKRKEALYYYRNVNRLSEIEKVLEQPTYFEMLSFSRPQVNVTKRQFERSVEKIKEHITNGDIFQSVLSKRYEFQFKGDLIHFYKALRKINPSPYMYFIKLGKRQIVGASPEMLVRVENRKVETFPIAGTRPCSTNATENRRLAKELLADPKERAEHVMLVDLARNDLGKISEFGSVRVPEFMQVHRYSHVQHIVSRVAGDLKENCGSFEALKAVFPAGTVSGAPKVRAMEIIEELESVRRGPYAGSVGYFSFNGNTDFAITIRTLFANGEKAYIQVGAGIVADSVPEKEWFETENKAAALMNALSFGGETR
jgi:anthranilate synthase component 1